MSDLFIDSDKQYNNFLMESQAEVNILSTGWSAIDEQIAYSGLPADTLFYLYAKAAVGKTYFVTNWIRKILKSSDNKKILFFSLEMSFRDILNRFLQGIALRSLDEVMEYVRDFKNTDVTMNLEAINFFERVKIYDRYYNIDQMEKIIDHEEPDIIFIDHLHRIRINVSTIFDKTTALSSALFHLKKKYSTRIVCLVQTKREGGKEREIPGTKIPTIESGKGSGAIEEDGDFILGLGRPDISPSCMGVDKFKIHGRFLKNRFSAGKYTGIMVWGYDPKTSILSEKYA